MYITVETPFYSSYGLHYIFPALTPPPEIIYTAASYVQLSEAAHITPNSTSKGSGLLQWYYFLEKERVLRQELQTSSLYKRFFSTLQQSNHCR